MDDETARAVAALEREYPAWQIWVVRRVYGGPVWWARHWDGSGKTINAGSSEDLAGYIAEAQN
jgi:hypothetical protein